MHTIVVSDIHHGSKHCEIERFIAFLRGLPPDADLVLNGDVVNRLHHPFPERHLHALDLLRHESERRRVIWVRGNHDEDFELPDPARIVFTRSHAIDRRLTISHGHHFDNVMPRSRLFISVFRMFHRLRILLGADSVHVAYYAKRFPFLYAVLRNAVAMNAVEYARENGFQAVACGHTHYVEERTIEGIRYCNTGSWTEEPVYFLEVRDADMHLVPVRPM